MTFKRMVINDNSFLVLIGSCSLVLSFFILLFWIGLDWTGAERDRCFGVGGECTGLLKPDSFTMIRLVVMMKKHTPVS